MNKEAVVGLEFEVGNEKSPPEKVITRGCFRVPVGESDRCSIRIGKIVYPVVNMSKGGIAFRTKPEEGYCPVENERIKATITLADQAFDVQAEVMYNSHDGKKNPLCGLRFVALDTVTAETLSAFYDVLKERLLMNKGGPA